MGNSVSDAWESVERYGYPRKTPTDVRCRFAVASSTRSRCQERARWFCPDVVVPMWCEDHKHSDDVRSADPDSGEQK